jgi:hypothetical protein
MPMLRFISFLFENEGSKHNEVMGRVYERETALALHDKSGAALNKNKAYQQKIADMRAAHESDKALLPASIRNTAIQRAHRSADAYLDSLHKQGISAADVNEVHHTSKGIDDLVGRTVNRSQNPHDVVVKTKSGKIHGASLKATTGTLSNNGIGTFNAHGQDTGIGGNTDSIWKKGAKKAGLEGKSVKEIKDKRNDPAVKSIYKDTQLESAQHHADSFNSASHADKVKHMEMLMKLGYDKSAPYDYVNGEKGTAEPIEQKKHVQLLRNAQSLRAVQKGNRVMIHDHTGTPILDIEHRSTHGAFAGNQVNAKLASSPRKTAKTTKGAAVIK